MRGESPKSYLRAMRGHSDGEMIFPVDGVGVASPEFIVIMMLYIIW